MSSKHFVRVRILLPSQIKTMAPNSFDQTTLNTPRVYYTASTTSSGWDNTPTDCTSASTGWDNNNYTITITSREQEIKIKKVLKKMMDEMCKSGWLCYFPNYLQPKLQPINLRGVRLDGRGWANQK